MRVGRPPDPLEMITEDAYRAVDRENKKKGRTLNDAEATEDLEGISMEEYVREYQCTGLRGANVGLPNARKSICLGVSSVEDGVLAS